MKREYRIRSCMLAFVVLVLLIIQPISVKAESIIQFNEKAQITDNSILYEIEISPDSNICGLSMEINYPEEQVKVIQSSMGEALDGGMGKCNSTISGKILLTYISTAPLKNGGVILSVELEPISNKNKNIDITCTITECIDQSCAELAHSYTTQEILNPKFSDSGQNQDAPDDEENVATGNTTATQAGVADSNGNNNQTSQTDAAQPTVGSQADSTQPTQTNQVAPQDTKPAEDIKDNSGDDQQTTPVVENKEDQLDGNVSEKTDAVITTGQQNQSNGTKTVYIVLSCVGAAVLLSLMYFVIVKPMLSKRRNGNEKM